MIAAVGYGSTALWYLTRASGLVSLVLLTATVVLGVVASVGWTTERWPRFLSQDVHRNISLFGLAFVGVHIVSTVADGFVPITFVGAVVPLASPYRPLWIGLGALAFDLLLTVLVTSGLRRRIGYASWRFVHWLAYLCWPVALVHGLGSGTDTPLAVVLLINVACIGAVLGAVGWRLATGRTFPPLRRALAGAGAAAATVGIVAFTALGPLRPGWAHRSGTSPAILSALAKRFAGASATPTVPTGGTSGSSGSSGSAAGTGGTPAVPFTDNLTGTQTQTAPDSQGNVQVTLSMHLSDAGATPLTVVLSGTAVPGGGVAMSSGSVTFGSLQGTVTSLSGGTIQITLATASAEALVVQLQVDQATGALSGTVSGSTGGGTGP